jgi:hypothetical protein
VFLGERWLQNTYDPKYALGLNSGHVKEIIVSAPTPADALYAIGVV